MILVYLFMFEKVGTKIYFNFEVLLKYVGIPMLHHTYTTNKVSTGSITKET